MAIRYSIKKGHYVYDTKGTIVYRTYETHYFSAGTKVQVKKFIRDKTRRHKGTFTKATKQFLEPRKSASKTERALLPLSIRVFAPKARLRVLKVQFSRTGINFLTCTCTAPETVTLPF